MIKKTTNIKINKNSEEIILSLHEYFASTAPEMKEEFLKQLNFFMKEKALENYPCPKHKNAWEFLYILKKQLIETDEKFNNNFKWQIVFNTVIEYYIEAVLKLKEVEIKEEKRKLQFFLKKTGLTVPEINFILENQVCNNEE